MSFTELLKTRRKFLSAAIEHIYGDKLVLSSREVSNLYAELLGEADHRTLKHLLSKSLDASLIRKIHKDWGTDDIEVFRKYIPGISTNEVFHLDDLSKPYWSGHSGLFVDKWRNTVLKLLINTPNMMFLRSGSEGMLADNLAYIFVGIANQSDNLKARNRVYLIVKLLELITKEKLVQSWTFNDIFALFKPHNFECLLDQLFDQSLVADSYAWKILQDRGDKDWTVYSSYETKYHEIQTTYENFGFRSDKALLSVPVDQTLFGNVGGLQQYQLDKEKFRQELLAEQNR